MHTFQNRRVNRALLRVLADSSRPFHSKAWKKETLPETLPESSGHEDVFQRQVFHASIPLEVLKPKREITINITFYSERLGAHGPDHFP